MDKNNNSIDERFDDEQFMEWVNNFSKSNRLYLKVLRAYIDN